MISALLAVTVGAAIGIYRGGRLQNLSGLTIERWQLLAVGVTVPLFVAFTGIPGGALLVVIALACLIAFSLLNFNITGMGVVAFGLFLNMIAIMVNGAMPVSPKAMVRADLAPDLATAMRSTLTAPREVQTAGDHLVFLGDIIPIGLFDQVLSFGDLILLFGLADIVMNSMLRRHKVEEARIELPATGGLKPAMSNRSVAA